MRVCGIDGCEEKHYAFSCCHKHYDYNRRRGTLHIPKKKTLTERILDNIKIVGGCWEWQKCVTPLGYGHIRTNGITRLAHRESYKVFVGEIPAGLYVMHSCDNPCCCNPEHLLVGTTQDNTRDRQEKGRGASGEQCGASKLTERDVLSIRSRLALGEKQAPIAREYNLDPSTISSIYTGRNWKHI